MADIADLADLAQQPITDAIIRTARNRAAQVHIEGDGYCIECGAVVLPVEHNGKLVTPRWCSEKCRAVWGKFND